jgi:hypothetical protein
MQLVAIDEAQNDTSWSHRRELKELKAVSGRFPLRFCFDSKRWHTFFFSALSF